MCICLRASQRKALQAFHQQLQRALPPGGPFCFSSMHIEKRPHISSQNASLSSFPPLLSCNTTLDNQHGSKRENRQRLEYSIIH